MHHLVPFDGLAVARPGIGWRDRWRRDQGKDDQHRRPHGRFSHASLHSAAAIGARIFSIGIVIDGRRPYLALEGSRVARANFARLIERPDRPRLIGVLQAVEGKRFYPMLDMPVVRPGFGGRNHCGSHQHRCRDNQRQKPDCRFFHAPLPMGDSIASPIYGTPSREAHSCGNPIKFPFSLGPATQAARKSDHD
jgi:hypothetical protein